jgi:hypothetical protein
LYHDELEDNVWASLGNAMRAIELEQGDSKQQRVVVVPRTFRPNFRVSSVMGWVATWDTIG